MQIRVFLSFVRKEFYHILRDKRTMLILFGIPIVQIILFGFAITTEVKNVSVAVVNPSKSPLTTKIIDRLDASKYFTVKEELQDPSEIDEVFRKAKVNMVIVFNNDFTDRLYNGGADIQLISDVADPNTSTISASYATQIIADVQQEMLPANMAKPKITSDIKLLYNPQMRSAYNFVPGVMGMLLMLICAMMTSISIVREKETGTMEVLLVSPIMPIFIILAKAVPYFVLSFVDLITILLLSVFVLHVPIAGSLVTLISLSLLFIFVSLSIGLLISTLTHTQVSAMLVSAVMLMMPAIFLSGMVFPIESMPALLRWISAVLPVRWYIQAVRKVMIEGVSFFYIYKEVCILLFFGFILITVSLKKFKNRLE